MVRPTHTPASSCQVVYTAPHKVRECSLFRLHTFLNTSDDLIKSLIAQEAAPSQSTTSGFVCVADVMWARDFLTFSLCDFPNWVPNMGSKDKDILLLSDSSASFKADKTVSHQSNASYHPSRGEFFEKRETRLDGAKKVTYILQTSDSHHVNSGFVTCFPHIKHVS